LTTRASARAHPPRLASECWTFTYSKQDDGDPAKSVVGMIERWEMYAHMPELLCGYGSR